MCACCSKAQLIEQMVRRPHLQLLALSQTISNDCGLGLGLIQAVQQLPVLQQVALQVGMTPSVVQGRMPAGHMFCSVLPGGNVSMASNRLALCSHMLRQGADLKHCLCAVDFHLERLVLGRWPTSKSASSAARRLHAHILPLTFEVARECSSCLSSPASCSLSCSSCCSRALRWDSSCGCICWMVSPSTCPSKPPLQQSSSDFVTCWLGLCKALC